MPDPMTILCAHVAHTLPDSLSERKRILTALAAMITPDHPAARDIRAQITALELAEQYQRDLPLRFQ